jgi:hypothetical protein
MKSFQFSVSVCSLQARTAQLVAATLKTEN